jgi:hypothetical protein
MLRSAFAVQRKPLQIQRKTREESDEASLGR